MTTPSHKAPTHDSLVASSVKRENDRDEEKMDRLLEASRELVRLHRAKNNPPKK